MMMKNHMGFGGIIRNWVQIYNPTSIRVQVKPKGSNENREKQPTLLKQDEDDALHYISN